MGPLLWQDKVAYRVNRAVTATAMAAIHVNYAKRAHMHRLQELQDVSHVDRGAIILTKELQYVSHVASGSGLILPRPYHVTSVACVPMAITVHIASQTSRSNAI